ncbi:MAG: hypothetical protein ACT4R6_06360 [Gemmatimonadaceae bacterium]
MSVSRLFRGLSLGMLLAAAAPLIAQSRRLPARLARADAAKVGPVEAEMRNVDFRVDERVVLNIQYLRGRLRGTRPNEAPWFDDPTSFSILIDSAVVSITPSSLTALLNTYVFDYPGSDIKNLRVSIENGELVQRGTLDKAINFRFTIRSRLSVTADGRVRMRPTSVKVAGLSVGGLMDFFGIELDEIAKVRRGRGVEIVDDDFLLAPELLLPPPLVRGRVKSVAIRNGRVEQVLVARERRTPPKLQPSTTRAPNYMLYQGGVLRFGKLTMDAADLQIVDADPKDPLDFFIARVNDQIVAGWSRNMNDYGLLTTVPDYGDMRRGRRDP